MNTLGAIVRSSAIALTPPILRSAAAKGFSWITGASDPDSPLRFGVGVPYLPVRQEDAGFNSAVMASVRWACTQVQEPPLAVEVPGKGGEPELDADHEAAALVRNPSALLADRDNRFGYAELVCGIVFSLMTDGNAYVHKLRQGRRVIGLEWLPPVFCEPVGFPGAPNRLSHYRVSLNGAWSNVPSEDVVHVMEGAPDPRSLLKSVSPLKSVMRLVMADNQIAVYTHGILRHPIPSVMMSPKSKEIDMDQEEVDALLKRLYRRSGGENAGGIAVPNLPMDVVVMGYKPKDMAVGDLAKLPEERTTAIFGIPAVVVGLGAGLDRATFANFKEAREMAAENFLVPTWSKIASALTDQLLPEFDTREGARFAFDLRRVRILQEDEDRLHQRVRDDFLANLIDRSTALTRLGAQPVPARDEGVYAFMLTKPSLPLDAPKMADDARSKAERLVS